MKAPSVIFVALLLSLPLHARPWVDSKNRVVEANVIGMNAGVVHLRMRGGKTLTVERRKLCDEDQELLRRFDLHKPTANRLEIVVRQALSHGALGEVYKVTETSGAEEVVVGRSSFDGRAITQTQIVTRQQRLLVAETAYVKGLNTAVDGEHIPFIGWTDGAYAYTTVASAAKSVPCFTLEPPTEAVSIKAEDFGK